MSSFAMNNIVIFLEANKKKEVRTLFVHHGSSFFLLLNYTHVHFFEKDTHIRKD
jgi:hypothetical protein